MPVFQSDCVAVAILATLETLLKNISQESLTIGYIHDLLIVR